MLSTSHRSDAVVGMACLVLCVPDCCRGPRVLFTIVFGVLFAQLLAFDSHGSSGCGAWITWIEWSTKH